MFVDISRSLIIGPPCSAARTPPVAAIVATTSMRGIHCLIRFLFMIDLLGRELKKDE
jgi:hypothetical protein